jgi:hypothetical protein
MEKRHHCCKEVSKFDSRGIVKDENKPDRNVGYIGIFNSTIFDMAFK